MNYHSAETLERILSGHRIIDEYRTGRVVVIHIAYGSGFAITTEDVKAFDEDGLDIFLFDNRTMHCLTLRLVKREMNENE